MHIDHGVVVHVDELHLAGIAVHGRFPEGVQIAHAVFIDNIRLFEFCLPAVAFVQHGTEGLPLGVQHGLRCAGSSGQAPQHRNADVFGAHGVVIILVLPGFFHGDDLRHDAHTGIVVADHPVIGQPVGAALCGLALDETYAGVIVGVHIVGFVHGGFPVDLLAAVFIQDEFPLFICQAGIGALGVPFILAAFIVRCTHFQVACQRLFRPEHKLVPIGGGGGINGNSSHFQPCRHLPQALFIQLGYLPDAAVGNVIAAGGEQLRVLIKIVVCGFGAAVGKLEAGDGGVQQGGLHACVHKLAQVHLLQGAPPLALALPVACPGCTGLGVGKVRRLGGVGILIRSRVRDDVVFNGIVNDDSLGGGIFRRGYPQAVGIIMAFVYRHLLLAVQALGPDAHQVVFYGLLQAGNRIRQCADRMAGFAVDKPVFIRIGVQVRQRIDDLPGHGGGVGVVAPCRRIGIALLVADGAQGITAQVFHCGLEGYIVDQVFAVFVHIHPGVGCVKLQHRAIGIADVVEVHGRWGQLRFHHQQRTAAVFVIFNGVHIGDGIIFAQLYRIRQGHHMGRQKIIPHAALFRRNHPCFHCRIIIAAFFQVALLRQRGGVMNHQPLVFGITFAGAFLGQRNAVAGAFIGGHGIVKIVIEYQRAIAFFIHPAVGVHDHIVSELGGGVFAFLKQLLHDVVHTVRGFHGDGGVHIPVQHGDIAMRCCFAAEHIADKGVAGIGYIFRENDGHAAGGDPGCFVHIHKGKLTQAILSPGGRGGGIPGILVIQLIFDHQVRVGQGAVGHIIPGAVGFLGIPHFLGCGNAQALEFKILCRQGRGFKIEEGLEIVRHLFPAQLPKGICIQLQRIQVPVDYGIVQRFVVKALCQCRRPGIAVAHRFHDEVHFHFIPAFQQVQGIAVQPVLIGDALGPLVYCKGTPGPLPFHRRIGNNHFVPGRCNLLGILTLFVAGIGNGFVRFRQCPDHFVLEVVHTGGFVGVGYLKGILAVCGPHVHRIGILGAGGGIGEMVPDLRRKINLAVGENLTVIIGAAQENAFPVGNILLFGFTVFPGHFLIGVAEHIFNVQRVGLVIMMGVIGIPANIYIVLRVRTFRQIGKQLFVQAGIVLKHFAVLVGAGNFHQGIQLCRDGRAGQLDGVPLVGYHFHVGGDGRRFAHIHHIHRTDAANAHFDADAGGGTDGAGIGQHIIAVDDLPVEIRALGRRSGYGQFQRAQQAGGIHHAHGFAVRPRFFVLTAVPHLGGNGDGDVPRRIVILARKFRFDPVHHFHFAVAYGGQVQVFLVVQLRLGRFGAFCRTLAVLGDPHNLDALNLGAVQVVGSARYCAAFCHSTKGPAAHKQHGNQHKPEPFHSVVRSVHLDPLFSACPLAAADVFLYLFRNAFCVRK